ncbi:outer mitochondrial transmembrane helix translocase-like [Macrosteles quadrilineatus]|uniref:outer mitochondrial transmembrane helix translocase-like n=1 Tax=Macrosteles quadrilineatus TaxID=74068 RepID=UPI0023E11474|nr:outer mitochondrial transmembrane helix translocase-like [Macrosteles quadrilineatus]
MGETITRGELVGLFVKISLISVASYFSMRWMLNQIDPTRKQKKSAKSKAQQQLKKLGILNPSTLSEYEIVIASHLVIPSEIQISWEDIAGLEDVIQELKETVILPIQRKDLFTSSQLTRAPKGILLHGPPGCGKTLIAKATAREAGTRFINLDVSMLTDKWYGESQKLAGAVFSLAIKLQPCIIFIDEIDSFLRARSSHDHEATAMMKAQFMALWDGLTSDPDCTVIIMGATNRPQDLDKAILRRMPATFHIGLPKLNQRVAIFSLIMEGEPTASDVDIQKLARMTDGFSGSDIRELCRNASVYRVRDYMRTGTGSRTIDGDGEEFHDALRPITMEDLTLSLEKMKKSRAHCGPPSLVNIPLD